MKKTSLKIAIVVSYSFPFVGSGIGNVAQKQGEHLAKLGNSVTLISSNIPQTQEEFVKNTVRYLKAPALNFLYRFHIPVPLFFFNKKILDALKNADVVHVHDMLYLSSLIAVLVAKYYKKPVVIMQHIPFVTYKNFLITFLEYISFITIGRVILAESKRILFCSSEVKKWLSEEKKKLVYLPNGVDTTFFHPVSSTHTFRLRKKYQIPVHIPVVLFVGRLVPKKGYDLLYSARQKNYLTIFVGSGQAPAKMKNDPLVIFLGAKSQEELKELYQLSDLFILPSHSEGCPLSVQEAMACGLPIIVSDLSCYRDMKLSRELVRFISVSVKNIKSAINFCLSHKEVIRRMSIYSRRTALMQYSWEKNAEELVGIYKEIIHE